MAKPLEGVGGTGAERGITSADVIAEARQRQADRLKAAQAENDKPTEIVEGAVNSQRSAIPPRRDIQPYRVKLDPDTQRLHTEVLNTTTGEVIMRIPQTYTDPADAPAEDGEPGAEPDGEAGRPPKGGVKA
ncbi:hypothetical protein [Azospirillum doebereinerae]|uniref:hypothetical protein n=1 Tax=Azospirillum doebereinerae TaxID=92933 RepID=UPI00163BBDFC|nr:hypothetical protein [Azospirillum doebereinerae]MCG5243498.1 hypothetical protein [Azospirillum doebereinerae]